MYHANRIANEYKNRETYIKSEIEKGNLDIEVELIYSSLRYLPYTRDIEYDPNMWPNSRIAKWYGIRSIGLK